MRFTVFAFSPIPDIQTARQNFDLHDLNDKDVAKVLYHRRKQHTGHSEMLNWDQLQIASLSLVHYSLDYVEMHSHTLSDLSEADLIRKFFTALSTSGRVVSWGGADLAIPLLHFRCMKHRISHPGYWDAVRQGQMVHTDLRTTLAPPGAEVPSLEDFARRFDFPGMLGHNRDSAWESTLRDDPEGVARYSDYQALNSYLLALEIFSLQGEMTYQDAARARNKLRDHLRKTAKPAERYQPFLDAWEAGA